MRLNSLGSAINGDGVGSIFIDGVAIPSLAGSTPNNWRWLTDLIVVGQADFGAGYHLYQVIVAPDTLSQIAATGYNFFAAGGGNYSKFLGGEGVTTNVTGMGPFPLAAVGDVSPDGFFAIIQNQQAGTGIITYNAAGVEKYRQSVTLASDQIRAKSGLYSYRDAAGMHLRNLTTGTLQSYAPRTGETTFQCIPIVVGTTTWVVEAVGSGVSTLSLRPATSSTGFMVATGDTFAVDVCELSAGVVRIGWCINAGESQTSLRLADITLSTGGLTSWTSASGTLVSSAGTPLTSAPFTVGPVEGGSLTSTKQPRQAAKPDGSGFVGSGGIRQYQAWWDTIAGQAVAPPNLSQATGVLDPGHGGTGTDTGLTVIDGGNILPGTIPCSAIQSDCLSALGSGWIPLVTGAEPPVFVTDGAGVLILVAGPS